MTVLAAVVALIASGHGHHADGCNHAYCQRRREVVAPYRARLDRIAWCETRRRWHLASGNGYYGGLQFAQSTWLANGGADFAARADLASREQQITVANRLYAKSGLQPWGCKP